jgi:Fe-Mn family superoxide dismutase
LAPYLSARTLEEHYEKHHKGYLRKLQKLIRGKPEETQELEDLIRDAEGEVFDNAGQVWNHDFLWHSMRPQGGGRPPDPVRGLLVTSFGSVADFEQRFAEAAIGHFGSGWAWLVEDARGRLQVQSTPNAENPLRTGFSPLLVRDGNSLQVTKTGNAEVPFTSGHVPLLAIDVWEHAYYLDYRSERGRYVRAFLDHLLNWDFVAENLAGSQSGRRARGGA